MQAAFAACEEAKTRDGARGLCWSGTRDAALLDDALAAVGRATWPALAAKPTARPALGGAADRLRVGLEAGLAELEYLLLLTLVAENTVLAVDEFAQWRG